MADFASPPDLRSDEETSSIDPQDHASSFNNGLCPVMRFRLDQDGHIPPPSYRFLDLPQQRLQRGPDRLSGFALSGEMSHAGHLTVDHGRVLVCRVRRLSGDFHQPAIQERQQGVLREVR
jgi:hypothetical protein